MSVEAPGVPFEPGAPCAPVITVFKPWLVIPALPPKPPNAAAAPSAGAAPAGPGTPAPAGPSTPGPPRIFASSPPPHAAMDAANNEAINSCPALDVLPNLTIDISRFFQFGPTYFPVGNRLSAFAAQCTVRYRTQRSNHVCPSAQKKKDPRGSFFIHVHLPLP